MAKIANKKLRDQARAKDVRLWEVAEALGFSANWFSIKMRHELPPEETARALKAVERLAKDRG